MEPSHSHAGRVQVGAVELSLLLLLLLQFALSSVCMCIVFSFLMGRGVTLVCRSAAFSTPLWPATARDEAQLHRQETESEGQSKEVEKEGGRRGQKATKQQTRTDPQVIKTLAERARRGGGEHEH